MRALFPWRLRLGAAEALTRLHRGGPLGGELTEWLGAPFIRGRGRNKGLDLHPRRLGLRGVGFGLGIGGSLRFGSGGDIRRLATAPLRRACAISSSTPPTS